MNAAPEGVDSPGPPAARIWTLRGCVQGSGVRPALLRWAAKCQLRGTVRNTREGLEVWLEGEAGKLHRFRAEMRENLPAECELSAIDEIAVEIRGWSGLTLVSDSVGGQAERPAGAGAAEAGKASLGVAPLATPVPRDRALCAVCRAEWMDVANRRGGYPWITCAACGPRYSILQRMPFERRDTTLSGFALCLACRREHESPDDRRFHAQTIGCRACGPRWWAVDDAGWRYEGGAREWLRDEPNGHELDSISPDNGALVFAVRVLREGQVLALRGVGGYQLLCDATSEVAVRRLRARKSRPTKPFAVLVGDLEAARQLAKLGACEQNLLTSADNPIVIAAARVPSPLAAAVHPEMREVGLMLPATAMHALLTRVLGVPLVCTSANAAGEPLLAGVEEAERRLLGIADGWLHHDREIVHPIDDSVVRCVAGRAVTLRLGRGLAPLPLELPSWVPRLAMGAHVKSAMALSNGRLAALGAHVGDLDTLAARQRFRDSCDAMLSLYGCEPIEVLHDAHPEYASTVEAHRRVARGRELGMQRSSAVVLRSVPHHAAHVAAGVLEHQLWHTCVLGVAWDGAGYGEDGLVWGGEFLRVDESGQWSHVGRWRPWELPGGDVAAREPWRVAVAILRQVAPVDEWLPLLRDRFAGRPLEPLLCWLDQAAPLTSAGRTGAVETEERRSLSITRTTSVGRLFDAAAACTLGVQEVSHEGEAAMWFESAADRRDEGVYPVTMHAPAVARLELDWRPLFRSLWRDVRRGETVGRISMRFHRTLARAIIDVSDLHARLPVVLSGGVFQNRLLGETLLEMAPRPERFRLPGRVPANDGGIAAGQLAYAALAGGSRSD